MLATVSWKLAPIFVLTSTLGCVDRAIHFRADGSGAGGQDSGGVDDEGTEDDGDEAEEVGGDPSCEPGPDTDCDGDGVPDGDDPFPDGDDPPPASNAVLYANTPEALYTFDPVDYSVGQIGVFTFDEGAPEQITDIAIDRYGFLYAVGTSTLYACDPQTVVCTPLDAVPGVNAAGFARTNDGDALLLAGFDGTVWRVDFDGRGAQAVEIGRFGVGGSSGDIAGNSAITVASINQDDGLERIRRIDPVDGQVIETAFPHPSFDRAWGLAFFGDQLFSFSPSGVIVFFEDANVYQNTELEFWGAASVPDW